MITSTSQPEKYLARFTDGAHEALADTTPEYGGKSAGFKPVDLLEAALANCVTMVVRIAADKRNIPLEGVEVQVTLNRENKDESVFEYKIDLRGQLTDDQKATLLRAASGCPVKKILGGAVSFKDVG
ncbi:MAG: OsmC family protein [Desulfovibrio sp.]|jgi:putative redox protein|nr:OsmC family protein [Desulfovibrio sp.]